MRYATRQQAAQHGLADAWDAHMGLAAPRPDRPVAGQPGALLGTLNQEEASLTRSVTHGRPTTRAELDGLRPNVPMSAPESSPGADIQPRRWELVIPDWNPLSLNVLMRKHWAAARRVKQLTQQLIAHTCAEAGMPRASRKRRVTMVVTIHRGRCGLDSDNAWKLVLDSLVKAGALVDDGPEWCECTPLVTERGKAKQTVIVLEDV